MIMNVAMTLQPTTKYSTLLSLLLSIALLLLFFSKIPLPPHAFVCAHSSTLLFSLLFAVIFQMHSLHSYCYELQNFENVHNFQQQTQIAFNGYPFFLSLNIFPITFIFSFTHHFLINT